MKLLETIGAFVGAWTGSVANAVIAAFDRAVSPRVVRVFGCSAPLESGAESITTVIAATTRKIATSYVQAVSGFHPAAVAVCTDIAERNAGRVKVFEQKARGHLDAARLSRALSIALGVA